MYARGWRTRPIVARSQPTGITPLPAPLQGRCHYTRRPNLRVSGHMCACVWWRPSPLPLSPACPQQPQFADTPTRNRRRHAPGASGVRRRDRAASSSSTCPPPEPAASGGAKALGSAANATINHHGVAPTTLRHRRSVTRAHHGLGADDGHRGAGAAGGPAAAALGLELLHRCCSLGQGRWGVR